MEQAALLFLISCGILFFLYRTLGEKRSRYELPPSPTSLPVLGHVHLLGKQPHKSLLELSKKHGEFMFLRLGIIKVFVVSSADSAREVLKGHDIMFSSRPLETSAAVYFGYKGLDLTWAPYGEYWRKVRKICMLEIFTNRQIELSKPCRQAEVSNLLSELLLFSEKKESVDLSLCLKNMVFNIMARMVLNKSYSSASNSKEREEALAFKDTFVESIKVLGSVNVGEMLPWLKWLELHKYKRLQAIHHHMDDFMQKQLEEHKRNWTTSQVPKDFIDSMLFLASEEELSDTTMKGLALDAIAAGTDTTSVTLEWAMSELMRNPALMKKAQQELDQVTGGKRSLEEEDLPNLPYLQAIIKETFRLHPAAPLLLPRESTQVCKVSQFVIPAKTRLLVNAYAIGRDPLSWDDPLKFDPERFLTDQGKLIDARGQHYQLLPFGSGRRSCPGMQLGITTIQYILGSLLTEFDWDKPYGSYDLDMSEEFGLTLPRAFPLVLVPGSRCIRPSA